MSVTGMAGMFNLKRLTPELVPPGEIFAGSSALFLLRLHNGKVRFPSFLIRVSCDQGTSAVLPYIPCRSYREIVLPVTFERRGTARIGMVRISSPFPVNFFTRFWTFAVDDEYLVYPRLLPASGAGAGREERSHAGPVVRGAGDDGELERISVYSGREPLRSIHWRHSARSNELLVKVFGRQSAPPLVIELDRLSGTLEERISRAAWLVRRWVIHRPVGLKAGEMSIPPACGAAQGTRLLKELALYGHT